jgi:hypothetical protein
VRDVVDAVGERVADADDDGVGLVLVDELTPLDSLGGGGAEGVAVKDVARKSS